MTDIHLKLWNLISFAEIPNRDLKKLADNLTKETEQYANQRVIEELEDIRMELNMYCFENKGESNDVATIVSRKIMKFKNNKI